MLPRRDRQPTPAVAAKLEAREEREKDFTSSWKKEEAKSAKN